jgi:hypothetical protein
LVIYDIQLYEILESDIYLLQLAEGVREALVNGGFSTIKSILESTTSDISKRVGIDPYVAQIIFEEAKRVTREMTKAPPVLDTSSLVASTAVAEKEEIV